MTRLLTLGALCILCFASVVSFAQSPSKRVPGFSVQIPFDFVLGDRTFPAGNYTVRRVLNSSPDKSTLEIVTLRHGAEVYQSAVVEIEGSEQTYPRPRVVFNRYGDRTYLSSIFVGGSRLTFHRSAQQVVAENAKPAPTELLADNVSSQDPQ